MYRYLFLVCFLLLSQVCVGQAGCDECTIMRLSETQKGLLFGFGSGATVFLMLATWYLTKYGLFCGPIKIAPATYSQMASDLDDPYSRKKLINTTIDRMI
jgi:hypothetical protein